MKVTGWTQGKEEWPTLRVIEIGPLPSTLYGCVYRDNGHPLPHYCLYDTSAALLGSLAGACDSHETLCVFSMSHPWVDYN